jgi:hypothetical protein
MTSVATGTFDEAYQRLHAIGPEFDGWLSNHGPMAAEAMTRRGQADSVHQWLDSYVRRLDAFPRGIGPIGAHWRQARGNPRRVADWTAHFRREVTGSRGNGCWARGGRGCCPGSRQPPRMASSALAMRCGRC